MDQWTGSKSFRLRDLPILVCGNGSWCDNVANKNRSKAIQQREKDIIDQLRNASTLPKRFFRWSV